MGTKRLANTGEAFAVLALVAMCSVSACVAEDDLGKYCFVGYEIEDSLLAGGQWNHADCQSGMCFKQPGYRCSDGTEDCDSFDWMKIWPICTRACATHSDCRASSDNVNGCAAFACQRSDPVAGPPVPCHCVCLDYVRDADGVALSTEAFDASEVSCAAP